MIEIDLIRHVKVLGKPALYGHTDVLPTPQENARLLKRLVAQQQTANAYQCIISSPLIRCQYLAKAFADKCQLPLTIVAQLKEMNFGHFDGTPFDDLYFDGSSVDDSVTHDLSAKGEMNRNVKVCAQQKHEQQVNVQKSSVQQGNGQKPELKWSEIERFFEAPAEVLLPEAESLSDFNQRITRAWQKLVEQQISIAMTQQTSKKPQRILVVAHGGVIRMILAHILTLDWQQSSWHQKLHIGYGSLSRISISLPYQKTKGESQPTSNKGIEPLLGDPLQQQRYNQLHQQVTSIAMPFIEGF